MFCFLFSFFCFIVHAQFFEFSGGVFKSPAHLELFNARFCCGFGVCVGCEEVAGCAVDVGFVEVCAEEFASAGVEEYTGYAAGFAVFFVEFSIAVGAGFYLFAVFDGH